MLERTLEIFSVTLKNNSVISFDDKSQISEYALNSVELMQSGGIITGDENNLFSPNQDVTRAMVAVMVYKIMNSK